MPVLQALGLEVSAWTGHAPSPLPRPPFPPPPPQFRVWGFGLGDEVSFLHILLFSIFEEAHHLEIFGPGTPTLNPRP